MGPKRASAKAANASPSRSPNRSSGSKISPPHSKIEKVPIGARKSATSPSSPKIQGTERSASLTRKSSSTSLSRGSMKESSPKERAPLPRTRSFSAVRQSKDKTGLSRKSSTSTLLKGKTPMRSQTQRSKGTGESPQSPASPTDARATRNITFSDNVLSLSSHSKPKFEKKQLVEYIQSDGTWIEADISYDDALEPYFTITVGGDPNREKGTIGSRLRFLGSDKALVKEDPETRSGSQSIGASNQIQSNELVNWGNEERQVEQVFADSSIVSSNIRVALRCRPPNKREIAGGEGGGVVVKVQTSAESAEGVVEVDEHGTFTFDVAFPMQTTQLEVFDSLGVEIVNSAFHGYNASLFAYGQTSSGKSFSMMGVANTDLVGLIPRISRLLFKATDSGDKSFLIETSYLEIYNEKLRDLLTDGDSHNHELRIRENLQLGVHVEGLNKEVVTSPEDTLAVIEHGFHQRTTAATLYNSESSRSHAVFEITIQGKYKDNLTGEDMVSSSRIALIDLAGSERSDKLGSKGKAMKEGNNINKSLTVLGRCIRALVDVSKGKRIAVPFRESVLTWYLRDSLSGNARTTMLAACSPVQSNIEETLSTLRYAASAKNIKTAAKKNEDPAQAKIRELASELEMLKHRLEEVELGSGGDMARHSKLDDLSKEDKERLFRELNNQLGYLSDADSFSMIKTNSRRKSTVFGVNLRSVLSKAKQHTEYPKLSCLNKDSLLSHAMTVPISSSIPFTIGRTVALKNTDNKDIENNNFELNGMGMKAKHCRFDLAAHASSPQEGLVIHSMSKGATVYVNGVEIPEESAQRDDYEPVILKHLDRVVLGPGRLICLYLTKPLEAYEREAWDYDACFKEMIQQGKQTSRESLISSTRRTIVEEMKAVQLKQITQANTIATEMAVPIRFTTDMVVRGKYGVEDPNLTIDDYFDCNDLRLLVRCYADKAQNIITAQDLAVASVAMDRENFRNRQQQQISAKKFASKPYHKKTSFQLWESIVESHEDEQDEEQRVSSTRSIQKVKEDEENDVEEETLEKQREAMLFELNLVDFEDLLEDLKLVHSSVSKITGGMMDASSDQGAKDMVHSVFTSLDEDNSGVIDRDELEKGLLIFNIDQDHETFLSVIWAEENLPEHISMNYEEFEKFLIRFMKRQFLSCIESYVSNRSLFVRLGGRDIQSLAKKAVKEKIHQRSITHSRASSYEVGDDLMAATPLATLLNQLGMVDRLAEFSSAEFGTTPSTSEVSAFSGGKSINQNIVLNQLLQGLKMKEMSLESQITETLEAKTNAHEREKAKLLSKITELEIINEFHGKPIEEIKLEETKVKKQMVDVATELKEAKDQLTSVRERLSTSEEQAELSSAKLRASKREIKDQESMVFVLKTSVNALKRKLAMLEAEFRSEASPRHRRGTVGAVVAAGIEEWEFQLKEQKDKSNLPADIHRNLQSVEERKSALQQQLKDITSELKILHDEIHQAMVDMEKEMMNHGDMGLSDVEDESEDEERASRLIDLGNTIKAKSKQADALQLEKNEVESELGKVESTVQRVSSKSELLRLNREYVDLEKQLNENKLALSSKVEDDKRASELLSQHQDSVIAYEEKVAMLSEEVKRLERRSSALKVSVSKEGHQHLSVQPSHVKSSEVELKRIQELEVKVKELESKLTSKTNEVTSAAEQVEEAKVHTTTDEKKYESLTQELDAAHEMVVDLQDRVEELEANEGSMIRMQLSLELSKQEYEDAVSREEKLKEELLEAQFMSNANSSTSEDKLSEMSASIECLTRKLEYAENELSQSKHRLKEVIEELEMVRANGDVKLKETDTIAKEYQLNVALAEAKKAAVERDNAIEKLKQFEANQQGAVNSASTDQENDLLDRAIASEAIRDQLKQQLLNLKKAAEDMRIERDAAVKQAKIEAGAAAAARRMAATARVERDKSLANIQNEANKLASKQIKQAKDAAEKARIERDEARLQAQAESSAAVGAAVLAAKMKSERAGSSVNADSSQARKRENFAERRERDKAPVSRQFTSQRRGSGDEMDENLELAGEDLETPASIHNHFLQASMLAYPLSFSMESMKNSFSETEPKDHEDDEVGEDTTKLNGDQHVETNDWDTFSNFVGEFSGGLLGVQTLSPQTTGSVSARKNTRLPRSNQCEQVKLAHRTDSLGEEEFPFIDAEEGTSM